MAVTSNAGRRAVISVLIIGLLVGVVLTPIATGEAAAQQAQPEADNTVTRIDVFENGSARWTIQIRTRLDTDQRVAEYTAFQDQFKSDTAAYLGPFRTRMKGVVADAENATGRQMRATNFSASTSIQEVPRRWGVVTYEFTWTNVATRENGRVILGDIFRGGFFISANDTLQVVAPEEYGLERVEPSPDSRDAGMLTWNGREDFADGRPRVAFAPATEQAGENGANTAVNTPSTGQSTLLGPVGGPTVVGLVTVVLLGLGGAAVYSRRTSEPVDSGDPDASDGGAEPPPAPDRESVTTAQGPGQSVLTDEERVRELLDANGGRVRQAMIAEEFDWSASKTSRVVGRMAEEGTVEKLQLGRENLVTLSDDDA
ncbi:MAG: helix-turn-helix transcriptional regulator [Halobellus sp.]|uniref:helix-turn-helix transcriptional regulator n=1 Tax=Halobellus sp. TaxID=1979212 RepID=UPI0035D40711